MRHELIYIARSSLYWRRSLARSWLYRLDGAVDIDEYDITTRKVIYYKNGILLSKSYMAATILREIVAILIFIIFANNPSTSRYYNKGRYLSETRTAKRRLYITIK